jgi:hypothetical protein
MGAASATRGRRGRRHRRDHRPGRGGGSPKDLDEQDPGIEYGDHKAEEHPGDEPVEPAAGLQQQRHRGDQERQAHWVITTRAPSLVGVGPTRPRSARTWITTRQPARPPAARCRAPSGTGRAPAPGWRRPGPQRGGRSPPRPGRAGSALEDPVKVDGDGHEQQPGQGGRGAGLGEEQLGPAGGRVGVHQRPPRRRAMRWSSSAPRPSLAAVASLGPSTHPRWRRCPVVAIGPPGPPIDRARAPYQARRAGPRGRSHNDAWVGCMVWSTTSRSSAVRVSRSTSWRSRALKAVIVRPAL